MKKKVLALLLSLVLVIGFCVPGTLAMTPANTGDVPGPEAKEPSDGAETAICTCGSADGLHQEGCALYTVPVLTNPDCTCGSLNAVHAQWCALYVAPGDTEPVCTCGAADGVHLEGCALYAAPGDTEPVCTCGAADGVHTADCPLYVQNAGNADAAFDALAMKQQLLTCTSQEAAEVLLSGLTEEQRNALLSVMTEDEIFALAASLGISTQEQTITEAKRYTAVGPLMPSVTVEPMFSTFSLFSAPPADNIMPYSDLDSNGLDLRKTAVYNGDGTTTITLEAFTTGKVTSQDNAIPADIVLVLDESGSMQDAIYQFSKVYQLDTDKEYYVKNGSSYTRVQYCNNRIYNHNGWYTGFHFIIHFGQQYIPMTSPSDTAAGHVQFYEASSASMSKREALISAANNFISKVYNDAVSNNVDHRVSVIGFSDNNNSVIKVPLVNDIRNNFSTVSNAINGLGANGGTYIEDGLANAEAAFRNAAPTENTQRNRVVVIFTDGIPGSGSWSSSTISGSANPAIQSSYTLKNTYGATVYTIGMLDNADPELAISDESNDTSRTNKFLHYLSSNYPQAQSMSEGGDGRNAGYYLSANDTESLTAIFEKISQEIAVPSIQLGTATEIRDIIAPQFQVPTGADVHFYTADYAGAGSFAERVPAADVRASFEGQTLIVNGFDYNANFVSDDGGARGKKLIIEFTITEKEGFLGGNGVYTNGEASGVYTDSGLIELFPRPTVDIPIKDVTVTAKDKYVYLGGGLTAEELVLDACVKCGDVDITNPATLQDWQTAYVTITPAGTTVSYNNLTADTTYTLTAAVTPKSGSGEKTGTSDAANIKVFIPEITWRDSQINLNETANYEDNRAETDFAVWINGRDTPADISAKGGRIIGEAPLLSYEYSPAAAAFQQDTPVQVRVKIANADVTEHVRFYREACDFAGCENTAKTEVSAADAQRINFVVHIKSFDLTITKEGAQPIDENQSFVFTISGPNSFSMKVVIHGSGSVTIKSLPVGSYTVTEDINWSWRYTPDAQTKTVNTSDVRNGAASVTFENVRSTEQTHSDNDWKWLNGCAWCDNRWIDKTAHKPSAAR